MARSESPEDGLGMLDHFASASFKPRDWIAQLINRKVTIDQIQEDHGLIKSLSSKTAQDLKRNVYTNYPHYIGASNEITKLESELSQLGNALDQQQKLLAALNTMCKTGMAPGGEPQQDEGSRLQMIKALDRGNPLLCGDSIHQGKVVCLDPVGRSLIGQGYALLLTNSLVIAIAHSVHGSTRATATEQLALHAVDPLSTLTVTHAIDTKNGLLITGISQSYTIACTSARDTRAWLVALRNTAAHVDADEEGMVAADGSGNEWLRDVPEEMDVCIAQRDFKTAVMHARRAQSVFQDSHSLTGMVDLRRAIDENIESLTETLCAELRRPAIRRAAIRANVQYLLDLGKSSLAHEVYLQNRSEAIKLRSRKVKMEGSTELYVLKLSRQFFATLLSTCIEFRELFDCSARSAYVSWATKELKIFATSFTDQVLQSLNKFPTVSQCVQNVMHQCNQLNDYGLDISHVLWKMLEAKTLEAIEDAGRGLLATTSTDLDIETWETQRFTGGNYARKQFVDKMFSHGCVQIEEFIDGRVCTLFEVTTNLVIKVYEYVSCAVHLLDLDLEAFLLPWLGEVFNLVVKWLSRNSTEDPIFEKNMQVILWLLEHSRLRIEEVTERPCSTLVVLEQDIRAMWDRDDAEEESLI